MSDHNFSSSSDQHDPKEFRESFGSFGTTTQPGANQLVELQTKVRQGVKHVELHLAGRGKGNFGQQDVPDKYGFEQRRTIMQLAKLNNQSLSVHSSFDIVSFSGLGQGGFNEAERANNIREIDESIKFAAETAKQGAVVFHIQGDPLPSSRGDLNLSKEYLDWLKENNSKEYERLEKEYFQSNPLDREFVDNIEQIKEIKIDYEKLSEEEKKYYSKEASKNNSEPWKEYFSEKSLEKAKVSPDYNPMVVVGDKITSAPRQQEMVDFDSLRKLDSKEKDIINQIGVNLDQSFTVEGYQKLNAIFTNGKPADLNITEQEFRDLKNKVLLDYKKIYKENNFMSGISDQKFYQKLIDNQIKLADLQKEDIEFNYKLYQDEAKQIKDFERKEREIVNELDLASKRGDESRVKELKILLNGGISREDEEEFEKIAAKAQSGKNLSPQEQQKAQEIQQNAQGANGIKYEKIRLMNKIGQLEYQKLEKYDELIAQTNEQKNKLEEQKNEIKSITDESFKKNTTAIAHLGTKALRYQLDLKQKSKDALDKKAQINKRVAELQKEYELEGDIAKQNKIHTELQKERYKLKNITGMKDYEDIDIVNKPLYLAPENMLPGYGSLTSIEEFKATVRMSQQEFAKKLLSDELEYKQLREEYEKETGMKILTQQDAFQVAKNHIGGTFDNAHAAVWLKHFKKENGESEEHRIERFNTWLNDQAVDMYKEGIIKHVHFNDTSGKDDDHNLLGQGILDIHDLRERLRGAGFKESLIVEAGGRGANSVMHLQNAWDIFNPSLFADENSAGGTGYKLQNNNSQFVGGQQVSDWMTIRREYENRPQYSQYGFGYNAFKPRQPQQGQQRGTWSGMGFL